MAKINSTSTVHNGYQFSGKATPLSSLTKNSDLLRLASKLHKQAIRMAEAEQNKQFYYCRPVHIPQNIRHIFQ
ncbi:hypothetical protein COW64_09020 [bacterium (Candidatus Blackallbacteria) CG18_big_fil_WC_8_21_14_2_50_49_26]|nr:MAG: hypothetical protein COW64_09020 [bacterium (Candidatus Blackallbacteria) CG18_big_fil_WC_8_21_14_2_50_49_26]